MGEGVINQFPGRKALSWVTKLWPPALTFSTLLAEESVCDSKHHEPVLRTGWLLRHRQGPLSGESFSMANLETIPHLHSEFPSPHESSESKEGTALSLAEKNQPVLRKPVLEPGTANLHTSLWRHGGSNMAGLLMSQQ